MCCKTFHCDVVSMTTSRNCLLPLSQCKLSSHCVAMVTSMKHNHVCGSLLVVVINGPLEYCLMMQLTKAKRRAHSLCMPRELTNSNTVI